MIYSIRLIFFKDWHDWFDDGWSFSKIDMIDSISVNLFQRLTRSIWSWSIFFRDQKDQKDGRSKDQKIEFPTQFENFTLNVAFYMEHAWGLRKSRLLPVGQNKLLGAGASPCCWCMLARTNGHLPRSFSSWAMLPARTRPTIAIIITSGTIMSIDNTLHTTIQQLSIEKIQRLNRNPAARGPIWLTKPGA